MIQTSYFAMAGRDENAVAISQGVPWWYKGKRMLELAPSRAMLNDVKRTGDSARFDEAMAALLDKLDAEKIVKALGDNAILLCWEGYNVRCHRRMVAEWLEAKLGIAVPELGHARKESIPYQDQEGKKKSGPRYVRQMFMF